MDLTKAGQILELTGEFSPEQFMDKYRELKLDYARRKEESTDLKTQLLYQMKLIELDDAYLYFSRHHM